MRISSQKTLSIVPIRSVRSARRLSLQSLHTLEFIHRFRRVTSRHIQLLHGHTLNTTCHRQLAHLQTHHYVARQYDPRDRVASYFLTPEGLALLKTYYPNKRFRLLRSVKADATMSVRNRERYHTLVDVYAHFKRHYDGRFEFFTAFDIAQLEFMPDEIPDGYVRLSLPGIAVQHYLIEIYGWNRSTGVQQRRLHSYVALAESERWQTLTGEPLPSLFAVAASQSSQRRLDANLERILESSLTDNFQIHTTTSHKLDGTASAIWRSASAS